MGDAKDKVRDEAQALMLKLMDQVAPPVVGLHFQTYSFLISVEISVKRAGNYSKSVKPRGTGKLEF